MSITRWQALSLTGVRRGALAYQDVVRWVSDPNHADPCLGLSDDILASWGSLGMTDWLHQRTREAHNGGGGWVADFLHLVLLQRGTWADLIDPCDAFALLLAYLVETPASSTSDAKALAAALAKLFRSVARDVQYLFWPDQWPQADRARVEDFLDAANKLRDLTDCSPYHVYGALVSTQQHEAHAGVARIDMYLREAKTWSLGVLPWSRHVPNAETLATQAACLWTAVNHALPNVPPHQLLVSIQPTGTHDYQAVCHHRAFDGQSLGLSLLLALFANMKEMQLDAWATGAISENGERVEPVTQVREKGAALGRFLRDKDSGLDPVVRGRFRSLVPRGNENVNDLVGGLREAAADRFADTFVAVETVDELLNPAILFDPFALELPQANSLASFYTPRGIAAVPAPNQDALVDDEFWAAAAPNDEASACGTLGADIAQRWQGADNRADTKEHAAFKQAREILACIPFHADANDAKTLLRHTAAKLAAYLAWSRARIQRGVDGHPGIAATLFPVPLILDLAQWNPDGDRKPSCDLASHLFAEAQQGTQEGCTANTLFGGLGPTPERMRVALNQPYRLGLIVIDSEVSECRQFEGSSRALGRLNTLTAHLRGDVPGVRPQCFVLLAPDLHVQLFWRVSLGERGFNFDPVPLAISATV